MFHGHVNNSRKLPKYTFWQDHCSRVYTLQRSKRRPLTVFFCGKDTPARGLKLSLTESGQIHTCKSISKSSINISNAWNIHELYLECVCAKSVCRHLMFRATMSTVHMRSDSIYPIYVVGLGQITYGQWCLILRSLAILENPYSAQTLTPSVTSLILQSSSVSSECLVLIKMFYILSGP